MFSLLLIGLLVIIAVSVHHHSPAYRAKLARRAAKAEALRQSRYTTRAQVAEGTATVAQMSRSKIVREQGESGGAYGRRLYQDRTAARVGRE